MLKHFIAQEAKWLSTEILILKITKPETVPSLPHVHEMIINFTFCFTSGVLSLLKMLKMEQAITCLNKLLTNVCQADLLRFCMLSAMF